MFSVRSVSRPYHDDQLRLQEIKILATTVRGAAPQIGVGLGMCTDSHHVKRAALCVTVACEEYSRVLSADCSKRRLLSFIHISKF
jgi:hypothetical protein